MDKQIERAIISAGLKCDNAWIDRALQRRVPGLPLLLMVSGVSVFDAIDRSLGTSRYFFDMDGVWKSSPN